MAGEPVAIVGAGPAGIRAAEVLANAGAAVTLIDAAPEPGGLAFRPPPAGIGAADLGGRGRRLLETAAALARRIDYRPATLAWDVRDRRLHVRHGGADEAIPFAALILATGASDLALPFAGWTRPGVFTLSAAEIALRQQGVAIGRRPVFVGSGPLLHLCAYRHMRAGVEVAAVLDTADPALARRRLLGLASGGLAFAGWLWCLGRLRAAKVPMLAGVRPVAAVGGERIEGLRCRNAEGEEFQVPADAVAMGFGRVPEARLAELAGAAFAYDGSLRQWLPETDADGQTSIAQVYLAGDAWRAGDARAAEAGGALAAVAALIELGYPVSVGMHRFWQTRAGYGETFRTALAAAFPPPVTLAAEAADDTPICRCRNLAAGALRRLQAADVGQAGALSGLGAGDCQGRFCAIAAAELLAAARGLPAEAVGRLAARPAPPG